MPFAATTGVPLSERKMRCRERTDRTAGRKIILHLALIRTARIRKAFRGAVRDLAELKDLSGAGPPAPKRVWEGVFGRCS